MNRDPPDGSAYSRGLRACRNPEGCVGGDTPAARWRSRNTSGPCLCTACARAGSLRAVDDEVIPIASGSLVAIVASNRGPVAGLLSSSTKSWAVPLPVVIWTMPVRFCALSGPRLRLHRIEQRIEIDEILADCRSASKLSIWSPASRTLAKRTVTLPGFPSMVSWPAPPSTVSLPSPPQPVVAKVAENDIVADAAVDRVVAGFRRAGGRCRRRR